LWHDANTGTISVWFTNGQTVTSSGVVGTTAGNRHIVNIAQIGDYNGDGKSDLLLLDSVGDVSMWLMNGATVTQALPVANVGTTWSVQNVNAD
jgi:hypothetical protein